MLAACSLLDEPLLSCWPHPCSPTTATQATVCARAGLECVVYMGEKDMERQALNVFRMRLLGAEVRMGQRRGASGRRGRQR